MQKWRTTRKLSGASIKEQAQLENQAKERRRLNAQSLGRNPKQAGAHLQECWAATYRKGDDTVAPWQWQGTATMRLYGASITSWSVHAGLHLRYVISASICMVAEHRQTQSQLHKMRWQLDCAGWAAAISPALGTEKGGSSSGTMIMWKKHLCCQGLDLGTEIERQGRGTFAKLRLKGATILIAALYLHVHDPAGELNPPLLEEVARVFELQC